MGHGALGSLAHFVSKKMKKDNKYVGKLKEELWKKKRRRLCYGNNNSGYKD